MEFDPVADLTGSKTVRYFEENLKPSIKAVIDENATHLNNYEELVVKAVRAKAKAGPQPSFYIWEIDIQVLRRNQPTYTTTYKV